MLDLLIRAGCFVSIIILGFVLRRIKFFDEHAFGVLSKIVVKVTLPASVVVGFSQMEMDPAMLTITALGIGGGVVYMIVGYVINLRRTREQKAYDLLQLPGYNIGIFTLPFVQSFLGPVGVVTANLFDTGNALVCQGTSFAVAKSIKSGKGFDLKIIGKTLATSVPFLFYITMLTLNLLRIRLPEPIISLAEIIRSGNAFLAMLMIGVGFQIKADKAQLGHILKIVLLRYSIAVAVALAFFYLLPFDLEIRQTLVILAFAPIGSTVPAFTRELEEDVGLSSAINSICILISIVIIVTLLSVMLGG